MLAEHIGIYYGLQGSSENVVHKAASDMFVLRAEDGQFPRFSALCLWLSATYRISLKRVSFCHHM
jgi:hypothetical protein